MTDKEKLEAIKAEVERLKSQLLRGACSSQIAMETRCKEEAYDEVISLLDSLQEEPVSEYLNEAAESYAATGEFLDNGKEMIDFQKEKSFKAGAKWKEWQMMAKAVDVTVHIDTGGYPYIPQLELYDYDKDVPLAKKGDKYKVVVIKEEESV